MKLINTLKSLAFIALGLGFASSAVADQWVRFTVTQRMGGSNQDRDLQLDEFALYDAQGNRLTENLTQGSSAGSLQPGQYFHDLNGCTCDHAGLFDGRYNDDAYTWHIANCADAGAKTISKPQVVTIRLASAAAPVVGYNLMSSDNTEHETFHARSPTAWKVEISSDGQTWQTFDDHAADESEPALNKKSTWYAGGGKERSTPTTVFSRGGVVRSVFLAGLHEDSRIVSSSPYATGGDLILQSGADEYIHVFYDSSAAHDFVVNRTMSAQVLVVGGGGGGGGESNDNDAGGGGGGAGGFVTKTLALGAGTYEVTVGAGGAGGFKDPPSGGKARGKGVAGGDSWIAQGTHMNAFAYGGGGGGAASTASGDGSKKDATSGCDGGSGGGSALYRDNINDHILGGSAIDSKQGHSGGPSITGCAGGGGGGAGAAGSAGNGDSTGGAGGAGLSSDILGSEYIFAGGGGGGCKSSSAGGGLGGSSVGGAGGSDSLPPTVGLMGLGGGGGGGGRGTASGAGAAGGSGIVIIRCTPRAVLAADGYTGAKKGFIVGTFNDGGANDYVVYFSDTNLNTRKTFTVATAGYAEILVVGGGGAGGNSTPNVSINSQTGTRGGGGGGAGGVVKGTVWLEAGEYSVDVGAGGTVNDLTGGKSQILFGSDPIAVAYGGGRGGTSTSGKSGASGGGGSGQDNNGGAVSSESSGAGNLGFAGGPGQNCDAGGGGGAGAAGTRGQWASNTEIGQGGRGIASSITGHEVWYAGGGGGGNRSYGNNGGKGGGGASNAGGGIANPGTDELGGGGAGASAKQDISNEPVRYGGKGGSGVVIVRMSATINDNYVSAIVGNTDVEVLDDGKGGWDNVFVFDDVNDAETDHYFTLKQNAYVRILTVGGGGSGGNSVNATGLTGGGGGGQVLDQMHYLSAGTYYVVTGRGGAQSVLSERNGLPSYVKAEEGGAVVQESLGGGGGGNGTASGSDGANGGGGGTHGELVYAGGTGSAGFNGGNAYRYSAFRRAAGGGGGAGAPGGTGTESSFGTGGDGVYSDIRNLPESNANAWYGGGGAGGFQREVNGEYNVAGGKGGGAKASFNTYTTLLRNPGENGKGGGGSGLSGTGNLNGTASGNGGGSGTVIVRILQPESILVDLQVTGVTSKGCNVKATLVGLGTEDEAARADVTISWGTTEECTLGSSTFNDCAKGAVCDCEIYDLILGTKYFIKATAVRQSDGFSGSKTTTIIPLAIDPTVTAYFVTPDAPGGGNGKSWASPYTLQEAFAAIAVATAGTTNEIYMKVGTYTKTDGAWTASINPCFVRFLGGYTGVSFNRSQTEYSVLDGESARGLVEVTVNNVSTDGSKSILFDQIEFTRGKGAYKISNNGTVNYWSQFNHCRFIDNVVTTSDTTIKGSAIEVAKGMSWLCVENCEFRGNKSCTDSATTIYAAEVQSQYNCGLKLSHSLFVGNSTKVRPCVAQFGGSQNNNVTIESCTFAYNAVANAANRTGGSIAAQGGLVLDQRDYLGPYEWNVSDTIFYGNRCNGSAGTDYKVWRPDSVSIQGTPTPQYLLFEKATAYSFGSVDPYARHYIYGDPLFVTPLPAAVEFDANYNPTWYADSAKTVTVSPAAMDVHLQSTKGRWNGSEWVIDANYSPAIDAGCPDSGFAEEPECNGGCINLGAYGNTPEASKSYDVTTEAATLSAATGCSELKRIDNGHAVLIYSNVTDSATFTVSEGGVARILVVGGGGNGGYGGAGYGGGGGGAGGVVEKSAMMLPAGTYTVVVGDSHQDSVLKDSSGTALITAVHGGNGGPGVSVYGSDRVDLVAGENGGSGGGAGGSGNTSVAYPGGTGIAGQGCDGSGGNYYVGHGGGGFSSAGTWGVESPATGGDGGNGYVSDITGEPCGYACGGGGGDGNNSGKVGKGGYVTIGGVKRTLGGNGGTGSTVGQPGVAGTGSGGGGTSNSGSNSGGAGGSGIVVVQLFKYWAPNVSFSAEASDSDPTEATVTLNVTDLGCEGGVLAVLRWGTTENCTEGAKILNGKNPLAAGMDPLVEELEGLIPGTKYYARVEFVRADRSVAEIAPEAEFTTKSVEASAYATLSGATGFSRWQRLDDGSTIFVFPYVPNSFQQGLNTTNNSEIGMIPASFTLKKAGYARLLVVGGGGAGGDYGYHVASGGGGGGQVVDQVLELVEGKYQVSVGAGGLVPPGAKTKDSHYAGGPSSVRSSGGADVLVALGGGGGANMDGDGGEGANGGGGSARHDNSVTPNLYPYGGSGVGTVGFDGGSAWGKTGVGAHFGGGGGGAGGFGGSASERSVENENGRGTGGSGLYSSILGLPESDDAAWFGGGGAGGAALDTSTQIQIVPGGCGGGGSTTGSQSTATPGMPNTGGGGSGGIPNHSEITPATAYGGSGIVVLRIYGAVEVPVTLDLNDGTGINTNEVQVAPGETMPTVERPTRSGYAFQGYTREGWEVTLMTGKERDIITNGTLEYAYSADGFPFTINNVEFNPSMNKNQSTCGSVGFDPEWKNVLNIGDGEGFVHGGYGYLMRGAVRAANDTQTERITLNDLQPNRTYLMQLICHDHPSVSGVNTRGLRVNGVDYECNTAALKQAYPDLGRAYPNSGSYFYGRSFVLRFKTASDSTSYTFEIGKYPADDNPGPYTSNSSAIQINALQVRDITGIDDPYDFKYYDANGEGLRTFDFMSPTTLPSEPPRLYAQWAEAATLPEGKKFVYNGEEQEGVPAGEHYTVVSDGSGTDAGEYSAELALESGYSWDFDGSTTNVWVQWSIAPAPIESVQLSADQVIGDGAAHQPSVASVTTANGITITDANCGWDVRFERDRKETEDFTSLGNISVVVTGKDNLTGTKVATFRIYDPTKIPLPRLTRTSYEYTGEDITPSFEPAPSDDTYTLSGVASTNEIGVYTVICTPKAGCSWENGQSGPYAVTWEIVRKQSFLERLAADPRRVNGEGETDFDTGLAQGGDLVYFDPADGAYIHIFTNTAAAATFTAKQDLNADMLLVGGGGGGGASRGYCGTGGGGGGAGGMVTDNGFYLDAGTYTIDVGAGGHAGVANVGGQGGMTSLKTATGTELYMALGGGRGASSVPEPEKEAGKGETSKGGNGASGGGNAALRAVYYTQDEGERSKGTPGQGCDGGLSSYGVSATATRQAAGGGGGAGENGGDGSVDGLGSKGGDGLPSMILGQKEWFAGGGAGAIHESYDYPPASGGVGGGGSGWWRKDQERYLAGDPESVVKQLLMNGENGLGGGGAGGTGSNNRYGQDGGRGGDGIVIIRYAAPRPIKVAVPTAKTGLFYNGMTQVGVPEGYGYTLSNHYSTAAGVFTATATLDYGYVWEGGSGESDLTREIGWEIAKVGITGVLLADYEATYDGTAKTPQIAAVMTDNGLQLTDATAGWIVTYERERVVTGDVTNEGRLQVVVTGKDSLTGAARANYRIVNPNKIALPRPTDVFKYTGAAITPTFTPAGGYTIGGQTTATAVGTYTVTCTLENGKTWENGSTEPYDVTWQIVDKTFLERLAEDEHIAGSSPIATGGDLILKRGNTYIHVFTNTSEVASFTPGANLNARVLLVGGGGAGGYGGGISDYGGGAGGGAGGMVEANGIGLAASQAYQVRVGAGAAALPSRTAYTMAEGFNCGSNSWLQLGGVPVVAVAYGGGNGGNWKGSGDPKYNPGQPGGSGGGGAWIKNGDANDQGGAGAPGQGHNGGVGVGKGDDITWVWGQAGGGGAGSAGEDGGTNISGKGYIAGNGGVGRCSGILGFEQYFAGGGGGGVGSGTIGHGGVGGGGNGRNSGATNLSEACGENGLGGGGGGGGSNGSAGTCPPGRGGDGIVIIAYEYVASDDSIAPVPESWKTVRQLNENGKIQVGVEAAAYGSTLSSNYYAGAVGEYTAIATLAPGYTKWSDGETALSREITWEIVEPGYTLRVISDTEGAPTIWVPEKWLKEAFPDAEVTQAAYQQKFLEKNQGGVAAWHAYVLGFAADEVDSAAIVEESVQNTNPLTVTIRLRDWEVREANKRTAETGCTLKYTLISARTPGELMTGGGTVVTNLAGKAYERCEKSTFEAPLSDLDDENPVNYYRIKVHFIFGGGGDAGEVIYQVSGAVSSGTEGWTIGGEVHSPKIDISSADAKYIQLKFKATEPCKMSRSFLYFYKTQESDANASLGDGIYSGDEQEYWHTYRVPDGANWIQLGFFNTSGHTGSAAPVTLADVEIAAVSEAQAVAGAKAVSAQFDKTLLNEVIADDLALASDSAWGRGLSGMKAALKGGASPYKVLVLTCSTLVHVQWEGLLAEQVRDRFPGANIDIDFFTQSDNDTAGRLKTALNNGLYDVTGYDCVMIHTSFLYRGDESNYESNLAALIDACKAKKPAIEIVVVSPLFTVEPRDGYFEYYTANVESYYTAFDSSWAHLSNSPPLES